MAPKGGPTYCSNLLPTVNGRARLLKTRAAKRHELYAIKEGIEFNEEAISSSKIAITSIEKTITHSEEALAIYEANLISIREIKARLQRMVPKLDLGPESENEDGSLAVCQRVTTYIGDSSGREVAPLDEQEAGLERRVRELSSMLASLRLELSDWQEDLIRAEESVDVMRTCKGKLDPILERIEALLSPVRMVPNEIWEHIFFLAVAGTNINPSKNAIEPTISSISNVCHNWRQITLSQPSFWTKIDVPIATWWPPETKATVARYISRGADRLPTFVIRSWSTSTWLSQAEMSASQRSLYIHDNERQKYRSSKKMPLDVKFYVGTQRDDLAPINIRSLCGDKKYALHLYTQPGDVRIEWRPEGINPHYPVSLTIQSTKPCTSDVIFDQLSFYAGCTDITLLDICSSAAALTSQPPPGLRRLRLQLSSFASFNVRPLLGSTLEELDLRHSGNETFHNFLSEHRLPALHTLALSVHDTNLFGKLRVPNLENLTIYGSQLPLKRALNYGVLTREPVPKLQQIRLVDWPTLDSGADAVETLKQVIDLAPRLSRIVFSNCALDGPRLLNLLKGLSNISSRELTVDICSVITQADCEQLSVLVRKLYVYV